MAHHRSILPRIAGFLLLMVLALLQLISVCDSVTTQSPTPLYVGCPAAPSSTHNYQSSTVDGKADCNYDMTNCNDNPEFLWGPVGSVLVGGARSAPCFGNLISGVTTVHNFSYVLGLYTEGDLPLDEETQAYIVRTNDGAVLAAANILDLDTVNDTDTYARVTATFEQPATLDPTLTYALYFCYVANASQHSDIYIVNIFQQQQQQVANHVASCLQYDDPSAASFPCFTSFGYAASQDIFNEFATTINFDCGEQPSPSPSTSTSPSTSASPSPSISRSPSPSISHSPSPSTSRSPSPSISRSPSRSPSHSPSASRSPSHSPSPSHISLPRVVHLTNVTAAFNRSSPGVTISSNGTSRGSVSTGFSGVSSNNLAVAISSFNDTTTQADGVVTHTYTAAVGSAELTLGYQYHENPASVSFGGSSYSVPSGSAKWTVEVSGGWPFGTADSFVVENSVTVGNNTSIDRVVAVANQPVAQMTTYLIYTTDSLLSVELQTFDFVLADGSQTPMQHSVTFSGSTATFHLTFSRFTNHLLYDPSLSMVSIVTNATASPLPNDAASDDDDDNTRLAVGLAVGLGGGFLLLLLLLLVIGVIVIYFVRKDGHGRFDITLFSSDV